MAILLIRYLTTVIFLILSFALFLESSQRNHHALAILSALLTGLSFSAFLTLASQVRSEFLCQAPSDCPQEQTLINH